MTEWELRKIFNDGRYHERVLAGELIAVVSAERPAAPEYNQPAGTTSTTAWYRTLDGHKVAFVHYFVRPDGTIGGSGRPDPKCIYLQDEILKI